MIDLRIPRGALLWTAAVGFALAGATSNAADRPGTFQVAAASSATDPNVKEIANYKLTMDAVRKFAQASKTIKQYEKDHPELNQDEEEDNDDDSASLDDMEAKLASVPAARKAIEAAGLSVREYVVITFAMLQSAISQYAIEQGADPAKIARDAGVHPANVTFYKEHKAEIEALTADMKEAETDE